MKIWENISLIICTGVILFFNYSSAYCSWVENGQFLEQTEIIAPIIFVKISDDNNYIFTFSEDSILRKWDYQSGNILYEKKIPHWKKFDNNFTDISKDGRFVLISKFIRNQYKCSGEIIKYDVLNDSVALRIAYTFDEFFTPQSGGAPPFAFGGGISALFHSGDSSIFSFVNLDLENASVALTGRIDSWDATTGIYEFKLKGNYINNFTFSKDGLNYAYSSVVSFPYESNREPVQKIYYNDIQIDSIIGPLVFDRNNKYLISSALYWDLDNFSKVEFNNSSEFKGTRNLFMSSNNGYITAIMEKEIKFFKFPNFVFAEKIYFPESNRSRYFSSNNSDIVYGAEDGILRIVRAGIFNQNLQSIFNSNKTIYYVGDSVKFNDFSNGNPTNWLWDFGDGQKSFEQNPVHVFNEAKNYTISLIVHKDDISDTLIREEYITIKDATTSVDDKINETIFFISPNPANEYIEINFERCPTSARCWTSDKIAIYNVLGERVKNLTPTLSKGEGVLRVDISDLVPGVYFVRIENKVEIFVKE